MFGRSFIYSTFVLGLLLVATTGFAQVVTGTISGRVTDSSGAVIPGTSVQIQNVGTGLSRNIETDAGGRYEARNLPVGSYTITVQQTGFRTEVRSGITLTVASEAVVNFALSVGEVQERVEVTAEAPAIETTNATLSGLISEDQLRSLPLNGRSFEQLALLAPGVVSPGSGGTLFGAGTRIASSGARQDANLYLMDGTTINNYTNAGRASTAGLNMGVEAIQEFRVLTHSFSAEYGRNAGGIISAVTRSGTNEFHGSVYEFLRNNKLDARNFFNLSKAPDPSPLPPFRQNQFGASLGGPVIRDRIFFFANYEGFRRRQGRTVIDFVPDENARRGLLPNPRTGELEPVAIHPGTVPWLNLYSLPNGRNFGNGTGESVRDSSAKADENYWMGRTDLRLSDGDNLYVRYIHNPSESTATPTNGPFYALDKTGNFFAILSETHIFSPTMLNEFRFAFNRTDVHLDRAVLKYGNGELDFIPGQGVGSITFTSRAGGGAVGSISGMGNGPFHPQFYPHNTWQGTDTVSLVTGPHTWKVGANFERYQTNNEILYARRGQYDFGTLRDFLVGTPNLVIFSIEGGNSRSQAVHGWRQSLFGVFVQDDFRVRPNLTLNLGLRYEFATSPDEVQGKSANLRHFMDSVSTIGPPFESHKRNFAPRAGLAWDPTGSGKTSIRLGGGVFYNHLLGKEWQVHSNQDSAFLERFQVATPPNWPRALLSGYQPGISATRSVQHDADTPTLYHYNLQVQREITSTISISAGYVGSHGSHLTLVGERDTRIPQIRLDGTKFFSRTAPLLNPNFSSILELLTAGTSNYHSLQLGFNKSFSGGLLLQANYTLAKNLSNADSISAPQLGNTAPNVVDLDDIDMDYSRSAYDQRHTLTVNNRYRLPFDNFLKPGWSRGIFGGWEINGTVRAGSGFPVDVGVGFNRSQNNDITVPERPSLAPGFSNDPTEGTTAGCQGVQAGQKLHTPDLWYDPCAFLLPEEGTFGNLGRNTVSGPPLFVVNFTMAKNFPIPAKEGMNLEFRAEFFNLFNHANFGTPATGVFVSSGARSGGVARVRDTATDNRQIQMGLRLTF